MYDVAGRNKGWLPAARRTAMAKKKDGRPPNGRLAVCQESPRPSVRRTVFFVSLFSFSMQKLHQ